MIPSNTTHAKNWTCSAMCFEAERFNQTMMDGYTVACRLLTSTFGMQEKHDCKIDAVYSLESRNHHAM